MKFSPLIVYISSAVVTPIALGFLQESVTIMVPWIIVMVAIVICDLIAGIRKSLKLGVHVSPSTAVRETMGKLLVYCAFVIVVSMLNVASGGGLDIAKWCCLAICALEIGSIFSNILRPYGINVSPRGLLKLIIAKATDSTIEEMDEVVKRDNIRKVREYEHDKWNRKGRSKNVK